VQRAVAHERDLAGAAGDHEHVRALHVAEFGVHDETQRAAVVAHRSGALADQHRLGAGQAAQDLVRAYRVEGGEAVEEQDGDLHGCGVLSGAGT
jgi:hypothetical protein